MSLADFEELARMEQKQHKCRKRIETLKELS